MSKMNGIITKNQNIIASLNNTLNNRNDKINKLLNTLNNMKNNNSSLIDKNNELIKRNTKLLDNIKKLKNKLASSETSKSIDNTNVNVITNISGIDEIYTHGNTTNYNIDNIMIKDNHKLFNYIISDNISKNDLEYKCWKVGCNQASIMAPSGKYQNIYCYKHCYNCDNKPICKIINCNLVAEYASSNSVQNPNRCKDHCKSPTTLSCISFKCSKYGCKNKANYSSSGYTDDELSCHEHKQIYSKEIKLYCNHYKCKNRPIYGYKEDRYPLVCSNHYSDLV